MPIERLLNWRERLACDPRLIAFTEDHRNGCLWVVAICRGRWACWSLLRDLRREEYQRVARRDARTLWIAPS